jgi:hypothetical protein
MAYLRVRRQDPESRPDPGQPTLGRDGADNRLGLSLGMGLRVLLRAADSVKRSFAAALK